MVDGDAVYAYLTPFRNGILQLKVVVTDNVEYVLAQFLKQFRISEKALKARAELFEGKLRLLQKLAEVGDGPCQGSAHDVAALSLTFHA